MIDGLRLNFSAGHAHRGGQVSRTAGVSSRSMGESKCGKRSRLRVLWLRPKRRVISPQSGRMIVAQQFTAGIKS